MGTSAAGAGAGSASASPDIVSMDLSSDAGSALFGENDDTPAAGAAAATASAALAVESVAAINISPAWLDASLTLLSVDDQPRPPAILMCGARNSGPSAHSTASLFLGPDLGFYPPPQASRLWGGSC